MPCAARTGIPVFKTKTDIEALLVTPGATGFAYATKGDSSLVPFSISGRKVQVMLVIPSIDDYARTPHNAGRLAAAQRSMWEQAYGIAAHTSVTCRMGPPSDPSATVDQFCSVNGLAGLRVIDTSIIPDVVRAITNVTMMMMAGRVAEFVEVSKGQEASETRFISGLIGYTQRGSTNQTTGNVIPHQHDLGTTEVASTLVGYPHRLPPSERFLGRTGIR